MTNEQSKDSFPEVVWPDDGDNAGQFERLYAEACRQHSAGTEDAQNNGEPGIAAANLGPWSEDFVGYVKQNGTVITVRQYTLRELIRDATAPLAYAHQENVSLDEPFIAVNQLTRRGNRLFIASDIDGACTSAHIDAALQYAPNALVEDLPTFQACLVNSSQPPAGKVSAMRMPSTKEPEEKRWQLLTEINPPDGLAQLDPEEWLSSDAAIRELLEDPGTRKTIKYHDRTELQAGYEMMAFVQKMNQLAEETAQQQEKQENRDKWMRRAKVALWLGAAALGIGMMEDANIDGGAGFDGGGLDTGSIDGVTAEAAAYTFPSGHDTATLLEGADTAGAEHAQEVKFGTGSLEGRFDTDMTHNGAPVTSDSSGNLTNTETGEQISKYDSGVTGS